MKHVLMKDKQRFVVPGSIAVLDQSTTDLAIVCKDGVVYGHQAILAWASTYLRQWFMSGLLVEEGGHRKDEVTIFLPDVGITPVSALTSFLLKGQITIRASGQFGKELEDAWELLRVDRITFQEATTGRNIERSGPGAGGSKTATKCAPNLISCPPGPPIKSGKNLSDNLPLSIPHNLVNNSNVSIILEKGEDVKDKNDEDIIEIVDTEPETKKVPVRAVVRNVAGGRSVRSNFGTNRNGFFSRSKLSQKLGVAKRNKVGKKIKESALKKFVISSGIRKSLRSRTVRGSYNEEELSRQGVRSTNEGSKSVKNTDIEIKNKIDDEQAERIKEKILGGKCPELKVSIKKLSTADRVVKLNSSDIAEIANSKTSGFSTTSTNSVILPSISITKAPINSTTNKKSSMKTSTTQKNSANIALRHIRTPGFAKSFASSRPARLPPPTQQLKKKPFIAPQSKTRTPTIPSNIKVSSVTNPSRTMKDTSVSLPTQSLPQSISITKVCDVVEKLEPVGNSGALKTGASLNAESIVSCGAGATVVLGGATLERIVGSNSVTVVSPSLPSTTLESVSLSVPKGPSVTRNVTVTSVGIFGTPAAGKILRMRGSGRMPVTTGAGRMPGTPSVGRMPRTPSTLRMAGTPSTLRTPGTPSALRTPGTTSTLRPPASPSALKKPGTPSALKMPVTPNALRMPGTLNALKIPRIPSTGKTPNAGTPRMKMAGTPWRMSGRGGTPGASRALSMSGVSRMGTPKQLNMPRTHLPKGVPTIANTNELLITSGTEGLSVSPNIGDPGTSETGRTFGASGSGGISNPSGTVRSVTPVPSTSVIVEPESMIKIPIEIVPDVSKTDFHDTLEVETGEAGLASLPPVTSESHDLFNTVTKEAGELEDGELLTCYICHKTEDSEGRKLNNTNIFFVRSHLSKCLYDAGKLFPAIPPGRANTDSNGFPIDEMGARTNSWYNCEVEGCWLAQKKGVAGQVCYKVYAIHMASQHGALEMVMLEEGEQARELVARLMNTKGQNKLILQSQGPIKKETAEEVEVTVV